jgi:hypothetical protein
MAIAINGTGTITGISVGGLNDSIITSSELANAAVTAAKLAAGAGGKILQVVQDTDNVASQYSVSGNSQTADVLSVSITPSYSNSKILIVAHAMAGTTYTFMAARIMKDGAIMTGINGDATDASSRNRAYSQLTTTGVSSQDQVSLDTFYIETLSSASTSTAITYSIQLINTDNGAQTLYLNRGANDTNTNVNRSRTSSSLIVMEVAP